MKKIFFWLLGFYTSNEKDRFEIYRALHKKCCEEYSEQNEFGNIKNSIVEFTMANDTIISQVKKNKQKELSDIGQIILSGYNSGIQYIKNEL